MSIYMSVADTGKLTLLIAKFCLIKWKLIDDNNESMLAL